MTTYLGSFDVGDLVILKIVWTPAEGESPTSGSTATLTRQEDGEVIGPLVADNDGTDTWITSFTPTAGGRWDVRWTSTPPGGAEKAWLYVEPA